MILGIVMTFIQFSFYFQIDRLYSSREKIADLSMDFKNNGIPNADEIPFTTTIEQSEFNHTFPKPIGWGRRKMDLGKTVTLDTR